MTSYYRAQFEPVDPWRGFWETFDDWQQKDPMGFALGLAFRGYVKATEHKEKAPPSSDGEPCPDGCLGRH